MIDLILYMIIIYFAMYFPEVFNYIICWYEMNNKLKKESYEDLLEKYKDL